MCGRSCCFQSDLIHNCARIGLSLLMLSEYAPSHIQAPDQAFCRTNNITVSLPTSCKPCSRCHATSLQV